LTVSKENGNEKIKKVQDSVSILAHSDMIAQHLNINKCPRSKRFFPFCKLSPLVDDSSFFLMSTEYLPHLPLALLKNLSKYFQKSFSSTANFKKRSMLVQRCIAFQRAQIIAHQKALAAAFINSYDTWLSRNSRWDYSRRSRISNAKNSATTKNSTNFSAERATNRRAAAIAAAVALNSTPATFDIAFASRNVELIADFLFASENLRSEKSLIDSMSLVDSETNASSHQPPLLEHITSSYGVAVVQQQHNSQPSFTSSTNLASNNGYPPSQVSGRIVYLQNAMPSPYYQNINGKFLLKLNYNRFVKIFRS
jgi:hypothetical protein